MKKYGKRNRLRRIPRSNRKQGQSEVESEKNVVMIERYDSLDKESKNSITPESESG